MVIAVVLNASHNRDCQLANRFFPILKGARQLFSHELSHLKYVLVAGILLYMHFDSRYQYRRWLFEALRGVRDRSTAIHRGRSVRRPISPWMRCKLPYMRLR